MNGADALAMLPLFVTGYGGTLLMLLAAYWRRQLPMFVATLVTLAAAFGTIIIAVPSGPRTVTGLLRIDSFSLYFSGLIIAGAFVITLLCYDYWAPRTFGRVIRCGPGLNPNLAGPPTPAFLASRISEESLSPTAAAKMSEREKGAFYVLVLFSVLGMEVIACSAHLVAFFLGVEIVSLSLYGLIGYAKGYRQSLEGAIKYLVLAATSSAFLLYGTALVYADTGTMSLVRLSSMRIGGHLSLLSSLGLALTLVVFAFKLAVAPFHMWSPDVYQGAPSPVTALVATGSKAAVLVLLLRFVTAAHLMSGGAAYTMLAVLSVASMTIGNLLALLQTNVKRLLAYSSVAHLGYLLIPVMASSTSGSSSVAFYLVAYFATTIAAFGVVSVVSGSRGMGEVEELREYRGLGYRRPLLALVFGLALLSLTGIPPTAGFFAKLYIFSAAAQSGLWWLLIVGLVNGGVSAFYYLRVLVAVYTQPDEEAELLPGAKPLAACALTVSTLIMLGFGIYPEPLTRLAQSAMRAAGALLR